MADAKITLNLNPREFDIIREVLKGARDVCSERSKLSSEWNQGASKDERQANNALGMELEGILGKLK